MNVNNNNTKIDLVIKPIAFAVACALSGQAFAADENTQNKEDKTSAIERISVTAQKRVSSLQETPIAITAFDNDAIENLGIEDIGDVSNMAPNVKIIPTFGSTFNVAMNIRGQSNAEPSLGVDPKVGVYLDGVYLARNAGALFSIVDLERMEILRGPQGTLWGKNTTGGAISLVTKKPSDEFELKQKFSMGSNDLFKSITSIDTGEFGNVTAKITYMTSEDDGWAKNTYEGAKEKNIGAEDVDAMRLALRYTGDDFTIDYSFDSTDGSSVSHPGQISNVRAHFADPAVPTMHMGTGKLYGGNVFAMMKANEHDDTRQTEFELDRHGREYVDIEGHNLTIEWDFSEDHTFKSISSSRTYESDLSGGIDLDGGAYMAAALDFSTNPPSVDYTDVIANPAFHSQNMKSQDQQSQEFQLLGEFMGGDLQYVAGYYYFSEEGEENNPWQINIFTGQGANLLFAEPLQWGGFFNVSSKAHAVFVNVDYKLTDQLSVIAGLRHTQDEKAVVNLSENDPMLRNDLGAEHDWTKTVGSLKFNYIMDEDLSVYGQVVQGYAAGAYNMGSVDRFAYLNPANLGEANYEGTLTPADPEDTIAYEIGVKTMMLDDRLMLNSAVFYNDNTNLQINELDGQVRRSKNSGESETLGFEIDAKFAATEALFFTASYGYRDTEYTRDEFTDVARYSASVAMNWTVAELEWGNVNFHTNYVMNDEYQFTATDPSLVADAYELLGARLSISDIKVGDDSNLKIALWGKNITDEEYVVHGANMGFYDTKVYGAPATYGMDITFEF